MKSTVEILGFDGGNDNIKIYGKKGIMKYTSLIGEYRDRNLRSSYSEFDIEFEYNNMKGFAGTLAEKESQYATTRKGSTKAHDEFLIRLLIGLSMYSDANEFKVAVGQPIIKMSEDVKMRSLIEGKHEIIVNGKLRELHIADVLVGPEGGVAYYSNEKQGKVRIIDLGSGTVNLATLEDGVYIDKESTTIGTGMKTSLTSNVLGMSQMIVNECMSFGWSEEDSVYICGGAAEQFIKYLQQFFVNCDLLKPKAKIREGRSYKIKELSPIYANAVGLYEAGKLVFENE